MHKIFFIEPRDKKNIGTNSDHYVTSQLMSHRGRMLYEFNRGEIVLSYEIIKFEIGSGVYFK